MGLPAGRSHCACCVRHAWASRGDYRHHDGQERRHFNGFQEHAWRRPRPDRKVRLRERWRRQFSVGLRQAHLPDGRLDPTVIDADSQKVVATIKLSGRPEFPTVDGKGNLYVNIENKNSIVKLDAKTKSVVVEWPLAGCESPSGMAIDTAGHRLFSVCDGKKMAVTDYLSGKVLANPPIGDSPDAAGFDAKNGLAFSSNGDGTLTVIDTKDASYKVVQTLATQKGARTMTFDSSNGRVYLVTAEMGPRPPATEAVPRPRPPVLPGSFQILVVERK